MLDIAERYEKIAKRAEARICVGRAGRLVLVKIIVESNPDPARST